MLMTTAAALALAAAQAQTAPPSPPPSRFVTVTEGSVAARPADVASIDAIMRAVYEVISGPAGQKRDWNRMRSLFTAKPDDAARALRRGFDMPFQS